MITTFELFAKFPTWLGSTGPLIGVEGPVCSVGTSSEFIEPSELELFENVNERVRVELELYLMILGQYQARSEHFELELLTLLASLYKKEQ